MFDRVEYQRKIRVQVIRELSKGTHRRNISAASIGRALGVTAPTVENILGMKFHAYMNTRRFDRGEADTARILYGRAVPGFGRKRLLAAGLRCAEQLGLHALARACLDTGGEVPGTTVYRHFSTDQTLQNAVAREAASRLFDGGTEMEADGIGPLPADALLKIAGQAVAMRLPAVQALPPDNKRTALLALL